MNVKNMLPPRGVSGERRATVERELMSMMASDSRRRHWLGTARRRSVAIGLAIGLGLGGVGTATAAGLGLFEGGTIHHVGPKTYPSSNHLEFSITPSSGPIGTVVTLRVTGCFDPKRDNHDVSYNAVGSLNLTTMQLQESYPHAISVIPTQQVGGDLSAKFRITYGPVRIGQFTAQCGASMEQRNFTVAGPLTPQG